jgi:hypothetical protein
VPSQSLVQGAFCHPGSYWLVGNEPNVGGQDGVAASDYATELQYYVSTIKGVDPTAKIVGPNVLNWDNTCTDCGGGFTSGHMWVDDFRATWTNTYHQDPPIDVWALHAYSIDWARAYSTPPQPLTDPSGPEADIAGMSDYLAASPGLATKPIWVSEFGVLWAYDGATDAPPNSCAAPPCIGPLGQYDQAAVSTWLRDFGGWLSTNASKYRLQRWFLYTSYGQPEPYASAYGGVSVVTGPQPGAALTESGQIYQQLALTPVP